MTEHLWPEDPEFERWEEADHAARQMTHAGELLGCAISNIGEAMWDFDPHLVDRTLEDLRVALGENMCEVLSDYRRLVEIHREHGDLDVGGHGWAGDAPERLTPRSWPAMPSPTARKASRIAALRRRSDLCMEHLEQLSSWIMKYLDEASGWYDDRNPDQIAVWILGNMCEIVGMVSDTCSLWRTHVYDHNIRLAKTQTGLHPPRFLEVEARMKETLEEIDRKFGPRPS
ncbi:hypothetical protein [Gordonia rubripertincta]|uniref:Uncharacterized protein n=1 Tax=Gordonia rubripertincta TaxID=36822 RepID=A0ABT4MZ91_GORRU|nr:hypothetical protein [Gordonia rubripertincta]MCZ4552330.1 hypothetical protein [Gordonia rubripertincta]